MAEDFSAFSGTGYRIKDDLVKHHKAVYGCEPRLFGDGSVLLNHVAVGPDIKPVGGDGKRSAMFYAGSDGTPLPVWDPCIGEECPAMHLCQEPGMRTDWLTETDRKAFGL